MEQTSDTAAVRVNIQNKLGLHARPAMAFVEVANQFPCDVRVKKGGQVVDGKSIMQMMMLAATVGTPLDITASGPQAQEALDALVALINRKFDEE